MSPANIVGLALGLSVFVPAGQAATGNLGFLTEIPYAGTGSGGKLTVVRTLEDPARRCREMHIANRAGGRAEANDIVFCLGEDGKWLLRPGA